MDYQRKNTGIVNTDRNAYLAAKMARRKQKEMVTLEERINTLEKKVNQLTEMINER